MDKLEKEVILDQLHTEKTVLRELRRQYERALRDIENRIKILQADDTPSRAYQADYQKSLKKQVEAILEKLHADEYDTIHKYLTDSYTDGYVGTMYAMGKGKKGIHVITPIDRNAAHKAIITDSKLKTELYAALGYDMDVLKKHVRQEITRGIATSLPYEQIARNISDRTTLPLANANRIVRTEGHRIQQASADDARNAAKAKGADVVKQWDASLDGATRPVHRQLDGQIREVDEPFEAGGYKVMYPGKFGRPEQDCNCRCVALTRARWALDEKELETLKERAKFFGLDKTESFTEYREKYLKAAKTVDITGKSGIIKVKKNPVKEAISSGIVSRTVNAAKQNRHIKGAVGYIAGRSYIDGSLEDAQRLVEELSGTGIPLFSRNGEWLNKERVQSDHVIGTHVEPDTGKETKTKKGMIVYAKTGSHIYPAKEGEE